MFKIFFALSQILPVIFYLSFIKRNKHEGLQVVFFYCLASIIFEYLFVVLRDKIDSFYLFASFTIIEYSLFSIFLFLSFPSKRLRIIPIIGSLIFYTIAIVNFQLKRSQTFDSLAASVESILIIIYSIIFLYGQITDPTVIFVYHKKKFWIVIAFFIYFSSTLFLFLYAATFTLQQNRTYWIINNTFDIVKNILFCIAFSMKKIKPAKYPLESLYADI